MTTIFLSCTKKTKTEKHNFEKVKISDEIVIIPNQSQYLFICKVSKKDLDNGFAKIDRNNDSLKIINIKNDGYESTQIEIVVDKNLKVNSAKYLYTDDVVDGSKTEYEVIEAKININKNPFKEGSKSIIANYLLKIKETYISSKFWESKKIKEFYFNGKIECK
ncbi:MAG: hypothetical protein EAZ15_08780 [Sphingobacteriales bacterium]|nr:MAG: hypothetical protein EAZ15_08780 [Sphingobacteriales bacterium]